MDQVSTQAVVTPQAAINPYQKTESIALFDASGGPFTGSDTTFEPATTGSAIGTVGKSVATAEPPANSLVPIKFTNGNTAASVTVAFAGGTARNVWLGGVAVFWFDGTILHQLGVYA